MFMILHNCFLICYVYALMLTMTETNKFLLRSISQNFRKKNELKVIIKIYGILYCCFNDSFGVRLL